jgi:hypothetical protein
MFSLYFGLGGLGRIVPLRAVCVGVFSVGKTCHCVVLVVGSNASVEWLTGLARCSCLLGLICDVERVSRAPGE